MAADTGLNCHNATIKYLLFVSNFAFAMCGFVGLALSASLLATQARAVGEISVVLAVLCGISVTMFLITSMGCLGAVQEHYCLLVVYAGCLAVTMLSMIIASSLLITYSDLADQHIERLFLFAKMGDVNKGIAVAAIQQQFRCCGYTSPSFWYRRNGSDLLPTSCCDGGALMPICSRRSPTVFPAGCRDAFLGFVKRYGIGFGSVGLAIALLQVLGIWFSLGLAIRIRELNRRMKGL